jgi:hypothetical protein
MSAFLLRSLAMSVLALTMTGSALAAASHPCASVVDPTERLACYDAAFPPADNVRIGTETAEELRARQLQEFGLTGVQKQAREPKQVRELRPDRIEATITSIFSNPTGERIVNLDNGQLWLLPEVTSKGRLAKGDLVVIRTAAMGTYMLVTPGRIALRAKRLQ